MNRKTFQLFGTLWEDLNLNRERGRLFTVNRLYYHETPSYSYKLT